MTKNPLGLLFRSIADRFVDAGTKEWPMDITGPCPMVWAVTDVRKIGFLHHTENNFHEDILAVHVNADGISGVHRILVGNERYFAHYLQGGRPQAGDMLSVTAGKAKGGLGVFDHLNVITIAPGELKKGGPVSYMADEEYVRDISFAPR